MTKIMMHGCNGVMGQVITKIVEETDDAVMAAGVDRQDDGHNDYPVYKNLSDCREDVDVIIDFSAAPAVDGLLEYAAEKKIPVVLCTTGLSDEQLEKVEETSRKTAAIHSSTKYQNNRYGDLPHFPILLSISVSSFFICFPDYNIPQRFKSRMPKQAARQPVSPFVPKPAAKTQKAIPSLICTFYIK